MSVENLKTKADLRRFMERELGEKKGMVNLDRVGGSLPYGRISGEASGATSLVWPGASALSEAEDIPHGLEGAPSTVLLSANGRIGAASVTVSNSGADATNLLSVQGETLDGSAPSAGSTVSFSWLARL